MDYPGEHFGHSLEFGYGCRNVSDLIFEKNRSDTYTAKGVAKTGVKVRMLKKCIGRRFSEKKIAKMRAQLKSLGVEYI